VGDTEPAPLLPSAAVFERVEGGGGDHTERPPLRRGHEPDQRVDRVGDQLAEVEAPGAGIPGSVGDADGQHRVGSGDLGGDDAAGGEEVGEGTEAVAVRDAGRRWVGRAGGHGRAPGRR
jgi:hypothetical protein